jgi:hypothetical protein
VGFVLQGVKPAAAQAAEWWQGAVLITEEPATGRDGGRPGFMGKENEKGLACLLT